MIRPRGRLTLWFGLVVVPFGTLLGLSPQWIPWAVGAIGLLGAVALLDALAVRPYVAGMSAEIPDIVRLTKDRDGSIPVTLSKGEASPPGPLRVGVPLPVWFSGSTYGQLVRLPEAEPRCQFELPCRSSRRGNWQVDRLYVEATSALGLWGWRRVLPVATELRTYPNLLPERKHLAALFLNRGGLGVHARRQVGQGREFERLRDYAPGDSFGDIHWRATAKRGRPVTKQYQIERTQEVYVIVDASRMSRRDVPMASASASDADANGNVLEYYIRAALVMGLVAERQGDHFGLATFSDHVHGFVRARSGKAHFDACRDALYRLEAAPVNPDFNELCAFLRVRLRRRALLVFLTSLDDPQLAETFQRNMELLGNHHVVIAAMFNPRGAEPLFSEPVSTVEEVYDALAGHLRWEDLRELSVALRGRGVLFTLLNAESMCIDLVTQYINVKQRQLL